jgi:ketosteroid isomerase-like protein
MKRFLILVTLLAAAAGAAAHGQAIRNVPTVTRNVALFGGLENDLLDAVAKRNHDALAQLVADDFELRSAAAPGTPTPREEAFKAWLKLAPFTSSVEQMAVHEYGDLMLVSFLWRIDAAKRAALPGAVFVVDTWKRGGAGWQLAVRYAAPAGAGPAVPGAVAPSAQSLNKRY